jgi:hypothetical protein
VNTYGKLITIIIGVAVVLTVSVLSYVLMNNDTINQIPQGCAVSYEYGCCGTEGIPDPIPYLEDKDSVYFQVLQDGKELFEMNCEPCHTLGVDGNYPDLMSLYPRRQKKWTTDFITNASMMIENKDSLALELNKKYGENAGIMSSFDYFTLYQLECITLYLGFPPNDSIILLEKKKGYSNTQLY